MKARPRFVRTTSARVQASATTSCLMSLVTSSSILISCLIQMASSEPVIKDFPPKLIHQPLSAELPVSSPHTIECPVEAQPPADVQWFKADHLVQVKPPHLAQQGTELMFLALAEADAGQYFCRAQNYLGSVTSERLSLKVHTTAAASDQDIRLEPTLVQVAAEQPAHFTCSLAGAHARVDWRRNGRKLLVKWLEEHEEPADARSRLVARRSGDNQYQLTIMRVHAKDDNATFTCQPATDQADQADELARESNPARLRVLLPAEDDAQESPATPQDSQRNSSAPLAEFGPRHRLSLHETLGDLFELSKPSLVLVGLLLCSVGLALVLVQLLKLRRRSTRRYVKHASIGQLYTPAGTSSSSCASAGLPASGSFESADCKPDTGGQSNLLRDPMLSSLMSRTLLGSGQPLAKQRSYRDNWRKVAAAELSGAPDQTHLYRGPNLYNQSLSAREQARSLLQASEHMRSLGNLSAAASQHNKHQLAGARATSALTKAFELHQQLAGGSANGSHLNLPLSFNLADGASMWRQNEHDEDEHYQLVKCDPSSSDSSVSGNSLATKTRHGQRGPSSNHYSVIEPSAHDELDWQQLAGASTGCLGSRQPSIRQQLSPYAVSSICNAIPPPVNSEAMRALTEQFDINQLMLLDQGQQQQNQHQHQQEARTAALQFFESAPCPPPPPPPPPPCPPVRQVRGSPANQ